MLAARFKAVKAENEDRNDRMKSSMPLIMAATEPEAIRRYLN